MKKIEDDAGGKPVLLVEGNTDIRILSYFLEQVSPGWQTGKAILCAGKKSQVIDAVSNYHPEWVGIVDKDEWSPDMINDKLRNLSRVKTLPRFCLENYFCVPEEIWPALTPASRQSPNDEFGQFQQPVLNDLPDWVAHGAMWRVIRKRRKVLLRESGFPAKLDREPVTDIAEIREILRDWHEQLDPDRIIREYRLELTETEELSANEQLKFYIHGKKFFKSVIVRLMNRFFGQASHDKWADRLTHSTYGIKTPSELELFFTEILGLFR
ncbi:hypothetical protein QUF80_17550 [Desulfococcaceae bacterium HSG8]|nr:hypothetical protein [Desulfococcaceae bacterium HSG8]